jgi:hypothetical protein
VVAHGQQIHGGIGFTKDYKIQLYFRRQKRGELMWGDGDYHREKVADALALQAGDRSKGTGSRGAGRGVRASWRYVPPMAQSAPEPPLVAGSCRH